MGMCLLVSSYWSYSWTSCTKSSKLTTEDKMKDLKDMELKLPLWGITAYLKVWDPLSQRSSGDLGERRRERVSLLPRADQPYLLSFNTDMPKSYSERSAHLKATIMLEHVKVMTV